MPNEVKLLPCPFCGVVPWSGPFRSHWAVQCTNPACHVKPDIVRSLRKTLAAHWNHRPTTLVTDEVVERVALVRQKQPFGCTAAVLAMILGITYEDAAAKLATDPAIFDTQGNGYHVMESQLVNHGFAVSRKWRVFQPGNQQRETWPCEPFADMHWCEVIAGPRGGHAVLMLRDGTVLDPMCDEPKKLADYAEVNFVAAVIALASMPTVVAGEQPSQSVGGLANIEGDEIVIRVPISTMQYAACGGMDQCNVQVTDDLQAAKGVVRYLNYEDEEGSTLVHFALDKALQLAVENGEDGFAEPPAQPGDA